MAEIRVRGLRKEFGGFVAVQDSSFEVRDGEFFVMLGPSGCGKTTTLRIIAGLETATAGTILLDGEDVTAKRGSQRDIAFVFQLFALYPHMGVRGNIGFPLKCQGMPRSEIKRRVDAALASLRIEHLASSRLRQLSGGDRQRVALGRAIVREPKAFLLDEPLGALDAEMRQTMCGELRMLHDRLSATMVYVTHDQFEAMAMADRIMVMNHGLIEQIGTPQEIYNRPATMHVADFIGSPPMAFLQASGPTGPEHGSVAVAGTSIPVAPLAEQRPSGELVLGIRPEQLELTESGGLRGRIYGTEYHGTVQMVAVETSAGQVCVRAPAGARAQRGETVGLLARTDLLSVFDPASGKALERAHG